MNQLSPDGPVYQAGTLSGNPIAMAAGLAQLRELERINGWKLLEELGTQFEEFAIDAIKFAAANPSRGGHAKIDVTFHRLGSMFCLFFAAGPVVDLASAQRSDLKMFARFFHACLKRGVYFAPSQFETGFISTAHTAEDIERTGAIIRQAGLNVVRVYHAPSRWFLDRCAASGMRVLVTLPWEKHIEFLRERSTRKQIAEVVRAAVTSHAGHPAIFGYLVGNEISSTMARWLGTRRVIEFVEELIQMGRATDPDALFSYATYPPTEYLLPQNADFCGFNVYLPI